MTLLLAITAGTSHRAGERVINKAVRMVATRDEDGDDRMSANKCWVNQPMVAKVPTKGKVMNFFAMGAFIMDVFLKCQWK